MLILESEKYALGDHLKELEKLIRKGVIIVFGCLENPQNIEKQRSANGFAPVLWKNHRRQKEGAYPAHAGA